MSTYRNKDGVNEVLTARGWIAEATLERSASPPPRDYKEKRCAHCGKNVVNPCGTEDAAAFCGNA